MIGSITRRQFVAGAAGTASTLAMPAIAQSGQRKRNVLLVVVDDMNDFCSVLNGYPDMVTPNFERLSAMGVTFLNAMAHVPACSPSRTSLLLGTAAYNNGVYFNSESWLDSPIATGHDSLIGHFRKNGFKTFGTGKVFHGVDTSLRPEDWDEYFLTVNWERSKDDLGHIVSQYAQDQWRERRVEVRDDFGPGDNGGRADIDHANWAAQKIAATFPNGGSFVACGFFRPHLPLVVPAEFINLYPTSPANPPGFYPGAARFEDNAADLSDVSNYAVSHDPTNWGPKLRAHDEYRSFLRAYLGSISFVDHSLGILIDAIEAGGFQENTYIVLCSDHGWQLGEKLGFTKFTLWERALRVPLIFAGPQISPTLKNVPVSLLDIYPTLCELLRIPIPGQCDGQSLKGLLKYGYPAHRKYAVSIWGNERLDAAFKAFSSVRTGRYRYIEYGGSGFPELYDHTSDPYEWHNVIERAPPELIQSLSALLPTRFAPPVPRHSGNDD